MFEKRIWIKESFDWIGERIIAKIASIVLPAVLMVVIGFVMWLTGFLENIVPARIIFYGIILFCVLMVAFSLVRHWWIPRTKTVSDGPSQPVPIPETTPESIIPKPKARILSELENWKPVIGKKKEWIKTLVDQHDQFLNCSQSSSGNRPGSGDAQKLGIETIDMVEELRELVIGSVWSGAFDKVLNIEKSSPCSLEMLRQDHTLVLTTILKIQEQENEIPNKLFRAKSKIGKVLVQGYKIRNLSSRRTRGNIFRFVDEMTKCLEETVTNMRKEQFLERDKKLRPHSRAILGLDDPFGFWVGVKDTPYLNRLISHIEDLLERLTIDDVR